MNISRREFLTKASLAGVVGAAASCGESRAIASDMPLVSDDWVGVLVDLTKCNGCRQCEAACQRVNGFEAPTDDALKDRSIFSQHRRPGPRAYTTVNEFAGQGNAVEPRPIYVKANCLHCNDPACVSACLVRAMEKQPNGAVTYDAWKCMGCRYCMVACPFQIPTYEYDNVLTPQVRKCTLCSNEGNPNKGGIPACVQACPKECLIYGKRNELLERAHEKIGQNPEVYIDHVYGEHEAGGTSWLYLSGVPFEQLAFLKVDSAAPPRLTEVIQHGVFKHFMPPVAWCAALGIAMWMSKPERGSKPPTTPYQNEDDSAHEMSVPTTDTRKTEGILT
ncbi:MAG: 4Fe-4S dicluster domain-containing protein [Phycisphaerae bacterium]|nr:4Fe-4S dicluster domain-containing protein [Phycisphaerae bacterium]